MSKEGRTTPKRQLGGVGQKSVLDYFLKKYANGVRTRDKEKKFLETII